MLIGAGRAGFSVELFLGDSCDVTPIATTTADDNGEFRFLVSAFANATTTVAVRFPEAPELGCFPVSYVHDDIAPAAPALAFVPPSGATLTPELQADSEADATIAAFVASDCTGTPFASVVTSGAMTATAYSCALSSPAASGAPVHAQCWGRNAENQRSENVPGPFSATQPAPATIGVFDSGSGALDFVPAALAGGGRHHLATADGALVSWGAADRGQLGDGAASASGIARVRGVTKVLAIAGSSARVRRRTPTCSRPRSTFPELFLNLGALSATPG